MNAPQSQSSMAPPWHALAAEQVADEEQGADHGVAVEEHHQRRDDGDDGDDDEEREFHG